MVDMVDAAQAAARRGAEPGGAELAGEEERSDAGRYGTEPGVVSAGGVLTGEAGAEATEQSVKGSPRRSPAESGHEVRLAATDGDEPVAFPATLDLAQLLARAARIRQLYGGQGELSYNSMLLSSLNSGDAVSRWFAERMAAGGDVTPALRHRGLDAEQVRRIAAEAVAEEELAQEWRPRGRARLLLTQAADLWSEVTGGSTSGSPVDVRHLLGAYVFTELESRDADLAWGDRAGWSPAFLAAIALLHPDELDGWVGVHRRAFPGVRPVIPDLGGPSAHIAPDIWTTEDALGYRPYAYAIYRFLTHRLTRPPVTISIQAPWGGGKTSLMRMVQGYLDPHAEREVAAEAKKPRGELTLGRVMGILDNVKALFRDDASARLPETPAGKEVENLTVWFNAWKYQSANQAWAGLVDAILQQVAARLELAEREEFWLRLNIRRLDTDKIRRRIYERILFHWWQAVRNWLVGLLGLLMAGVIAVVGGWLTGTSVLEGVGGAGIVAAVVGAVGALVQTLAGAKANAEAEPAVVSLSEYLDVPDYRAELGFIHHAEADLRRALASVPPNYLPIVVFIDDLDRCSPGNVAKVLEAVNLFLAGEFANCHFVLGMDTEMVAAALQAEHKELIAQLPADAGTPIGWRFMDKFVQLPFLIPPPSDSDVKRYAASLFSADGVAAEGGADPLVREIAVEAATPEDVGGVVERLQRDGRLAEGRAAMVQRQAEEQVVLRVLEEGIAKSSDERPDVQRLIAAAGPYFRGNPRDWKRFVNAFRLQRFLWRARRAQGLDAPTLDQVMRWTVLSIKWPEVVRWLRRGGGGEWLVGSSPTPAGGVVHTFTSRLTLIEEVSGQAADLVGWQRLAEQRLRLKATEVAWLSDHDLLQFFLGESTAVVNGGRLSDGVGKGLW